MDTGNTVRLIRIRINGAVIEAPLTPNTLHLLEKLAKVARRASKEAVTDRPKAADNVGKED